MVSRETEKCEGCEHRKIGLRWRPKHLFRADEIAREEDVRDREAKKGQGDPGHVGQALLDRNERESPEEDEEGHRGVEGPTATGPGPRRHIGATRRDDKKLRPAV